MAIVAPDRGSMLLFNSPTTLSIHHSCEHHLALMTRASSWSPSGRGAQRGRAPAGLRQMHRRAARRSQAADRRRDGTRQKAMSPTASATFGAGATRMTSDRGGKLGRLFSTASRIRPSRAAHSRARRRPHRAVSTLHGSSSQQIFAGVSGGCGIRTHDEAHAP